MKETGLKTDGRGKTELIIALWLLATPSLHVDAFRLLFSSKESEGAVYYYTDLSYQIVQH